MNDEELELLELARNYFRQIGGFKVAAAIANARAESMVYSCVRCPNCDNLRLELGAERQSMRAYRVLRVAVEAMMAPLGYHGEISARDDRVQAVMDALSQCDEEDK